jgi:predicted porin
VTISGVMDYAFASQSGSAAGVKGQTVSTNIGTSATSVIRFIAVEDLGGGMKATAQYNLDPRTFSNDGTAMGRDEVFMGLSGGFGNIRLGSPNSPTLATFLASSPLGTGVGSGYVGLEFGNTAVPRYNRSVRYDTPNMNGLTLSAVYVPGNDEANTASAAANGIPNARASSELGAAYSNGALNINLAYRTIDAADYNATPFALRTTNGAVWFDTFAATATAGAKSTWTSVAANYKFGSTTLYAGMNDGKTNGALDTKGNRVAVKHNMGAIDLIAQYATQKTGATEHKVTGLRADYSLSKRTAAYAGYENYDFGATDRKITSVGVRHAF